MKDITGFEGLYAVTSCGKVWSYYSKKFLVQRYDKCGYPRVTLHKDGKLYTKYIHRLVAEAFIPNPEGKAQVDHIDEVKTHNWLGNLQWVTPAENSRRSNLGRKKTWNSKVKPIYCVELDRVFKSQAEACRALGLSQTPLCYALNGKRQTCGGYHWELYHEEEAEA